MNKEKFMEEIKLLENVGECFSFVLEDDSAKGIVVMVEENDTSEGDPREYLIEPNNVVNGDAFEPIGDWDYCCAYLDWDKAWELCQTAIKDMLEVQ